MSNSNKHEEIVGKNVVDYEEIDRYSSAVNKAGVSAAAGSFEPVAAAIPPETLRLINEFRARHPDSRSPAQRAEQSQKLAARAISLNFFRSNGK